MIEGLPRAGEIDWAYIIGSIIISIPSILAWFSARRASRKVGIVEAKVDESHVNLEQKVEQIHVAVNSERTAMLEKIEEMHRTILELTREAASKA